MRYIRNTSNRIHGCVPFQEVFSCLLTIHLDSTRVRGQVLLLEVEVQFL